MVLPALAAAGAAGTIAAGAQAAPWAFGEWNRKNERTKERQNLIKNIGKGNIEPEVAARIIQGYSPTYLARKLADYEHSAGTKKRQKHPEYQTFYEILQNEQRRRSGLPPTPNTGLAALAQAQGRELPVQLGGGTPEQQAAYQQQGQAQGGGGPGGFPGGDAYGPRKMGGEGNFMQGYGSQVEQFPIYTPQQHGIMNRLLPQAAQGIESYKEGFAPLEEKARRDYLEKTIPSIAERFTQSGGRGSSGFRNALGESAKSFETDIGELGSRYSLARQGLLQNMLSSLLTPSYESFYSPQQPGLLQSLAGAAIPGVAQGLGQLINEGGQWAGGKLGNMFNGNGQQGAVQQGGGYQSGGGQQGGTGPYTGGAQGQQYGQQAQQLYGQAAPRLSQGQQMRLGEQFPGLAQQAQTQQSSLGPRNPAYQQPTVASVSQTPGQLPAQQQTPAYMQNTAPFGVQSFADRFKFGGR